MAANVLAGSPKGDRPTVDSRIEAIGEQIQRLTGAIEGLEKRLDTVLLPDTPEPCPPTEPTPINPRVTMKLSKISEWLGQLAVRINKINDRVEL